MFILAVVSGQHIYAYHDKIYRTRATADNALKVLKSGFKPKLDGSYKVHEIEKVFLKNL